MNAYLQAKLVGAKEAVWLLTQVEKQAKFASSRALNNGIFKARRWTIDELLPEKFTLRGRSRKWHQSGKFSFKVTKKADKRNLVAELKSIAPWLPAHEFGGTKKPRYKLPGVAVVAGARPSKGEIVPKPYVAKRVLKKGGYVVNTPKGHLILIRDPGEPTGNKALHYLPKTTRIKKTLGFRKKAPPIVIKEFRARFPKHFENAMKSAKKRMPKILK